ncbi:MAG TPA: tryptophan synthase subunit alpha, partial [Burkholderiaceae bacterium]|nr:tryptophan synthase subunit alpha [Burkholderiaceae bacterium]
GTKIIQVISDMPYEKVVPSVKNFLREIRAALDEN